MKVTWFPKPDDGAKNVEHAVAYTEPVVAATKKAAEKIAREARNILDVTSGSHEAKDSAVPRSSIDIIHEDSGTWLDSIVTLEAAWATEEEGGSSGDLAAALSIEVGHFSRSRKSAGYGPLTEDGHGRVWVEGVAPLRNAAKKISRNVPQS